MSPWKDFLSLPDPKFPCQDIREEQLEKTVAYVQALQYWVEKSNPPMPGQPCLLVGECPQIEGDDGVVLFPSLMTQSWMV